jgi:ribosomal protein S24E
MNILKDFKNELLKRREIKMVVESQKNPSYEEAMKTVSGEFKAQEEAIVVKGIHGKFGRKTFLIEALIYDSKEDKEKTEQKSKKEKEAEKAAQKEAEKSAETKPAAPAEEKK